MEKLDTKIDQVLFVWDCMPNSGLVGKVTGLDALFETRKAFLERVHTSSDHDKTILQGIDEMCSNDVALAETQISMETLCGALLLQMLYEGGFLTSFATCKDFCCPVKIDTKEKVSELRKGTLLCTVCETPLLLRNRHILCSPVPVMSAVMGRSTQCHGIQYHVINTQEMDNKDSTWYSFANGERKKLLSNTLCSIQRYDAVTGATLNEPLYREYNGQKLKYYAMVPGTKEISGVLLINQVTLGSGNKAWMISLQIIDFEEKSDNTIVLGTIPFFQNDDTNYNVFVDYLLENVLKDAIIKGFTLRQPHNIVCFLNIVALGGDPEGIKTVFGVTNLSSVHGDQNSTPPDQTSAASISSKRRPSAVHQVATEDCVKWLLNSQKGEMIRPHICSRSSCKEVDFSKGVPVAASCGVNSPKRELPDFKDIITHSLSSLENGMCAIANVSYYIGALATHALNILADTSKTDTGLSFSRSELDALNNMVVETYRIKDISGGQNSDLPKEVPVLGTPLDYEQTTLVLELLCVFFGEYPAGLRINQTFQQYLTQLTLIKNKLYDSRLRDEDLELLTHVCLGLFDIYKELCVTGHFIDPTNENDRIVNSYIRLLPRFGLQVLQFGSLVDYVTSESSKRQLAIAQSTASSTRGTLNFSVKLALNTSMWCLAYWNNYKSFEFRKILKGSDLNSESDDE